VSTETTDHQARAAKGARRYYATCTCGWATPGGMTKSAAAELAAEHEANPPEPELSARPGLVRARKAAGLTQATLADLLGLNRVQVNRWERGAETPNVDTALRVGAALGATVEELFSTAPGTGAGRSHPEETPETVQEAS
jgi:DNA-binding XRE family transcriptional regulator